MGFDRWLDKNIYSLLGIEFIVLLTLSIYFSVIGFNNTILEIDSIEIISRSNYSYFEGLKNMLAFYSFVIMMSLFGIIYFVWREVTGKNIIKS